MVHIGALLALIEWHYWHLKDDWWGVNPCIQIHCIASHYYRTMVCYNIETLQLHVLYQMILELYHVNLPLSHEKSHETYADIGFGTQITFKTLNDLSINQTMILISLPCVILLNRIRFKNLSRAWVFDGIFIFNA